MNKREIKFRAWDSVHEVMINPYCELREGERFYAHDLTNSCAVIAAGSVMQYTGLKVVDGRGKSVDRLSGVEGREGLRIMDCMNCDCTVSTGCKGKGEQPMPERPKRKYVMSKPRGRRGPRPTAENPDNDCDRCGKSIWIHPEMDAAGAWRKGDTCEKFVKEGKDGAEAG